MENHPTVKIVPNAPGKSPDKPSDKPPDDTLPPGSLLNQGKYRIERVLGRGGFGVTYLALDQSLGLRVAVKECLPRNAAWRDGSSASVRWGFSAPEQENALENFVREARKMAKIDQIPGVVRVREYFYDNDTAYIVMDYVDSETLTERLSRTGPMEAAECFRLLSPVMDSLALAHGRGLVHRDVSPNNIMIERDNEKVWLSDLGAAKDMGTRAFAPNVSNGTQIVGTPGYTPLEQYDMDGKIGPWTDIYALCAVFIRCMTGQAPPPSTSRVLRDSVPERLRPFPGPVGEALLKGMAQNPEDRYQSMAELRDALEKAIFPKPKPKPKLPPPGRNSVVLISLAVTVLILVVIWTVRPAQIVASGKCGDNVSWTLDENGLMKISGTGDMDDYEDDDAPWKQYTEAIFDVRILKGITRIGAHAFKYCDNLRDVKLPDGLATIGNYAFCNCSSLAGVTIPDGVITIEERAFLNNSNLVSVTIPDSVRTIEKFAFGYCISLRSVTIPHGITEIADFTFDSCRSLRSVTIPDGVTSIGWAAFRYCSDLWYVTIPYGVTEIRSFTFEGCSSLLNVSIPDDVTSIGWAAFKDCSSLQSVTIPDSLTDINMSAFSGCSSLERVSIPGGVTTIEEHAFDSCINLRDVTISEGVEVIGDFAFGGCTRLENVTLPNYSLTRIGEFAFVECTSLSGGAIPDSVVIIGEGAFRGCTNMASMSLSSETRMANAFDENTVVIRR